jgi:hypothetical protein
VWLNLNFVLFEMEHVIAFNRKYTIFIKIAAFAERYGDFLFPEGGGENFERIFFYDLQFDN